jgi:hypothetical protein
MGQILEQGGPIGKASDMPEVAERLETRLFELGNPALANLLQRHRIEEVTVENQP